MDRPRYLIAKGSAGLGNRLLALATALVYARLSGRRLVIDWCDAVYSNRGENAFESLFDRPASGPLGELYDSDSVAPGVWRGNLRLTSREMQQRCGQIPASDPKVWKRVSIDVRKLGYQEDVAVFHSLFESIQPLLRHFDDELGSHWGTRGEQVLRNVLRREIVPRAEILESIERFREEHLSAPAVGIHIRLTDRGTRLQAMRRRLDRLLKRQPELTVFLATDNRGVVDSFRQRYPRLATTEKWYPPDGAPLHRASDCPDRAENGIRALTDMRLLACCRHLILEEGSTFAYLARLLSDAPAADIHNFEYGRFLPRPWRHALAGAFIGARARLWRVLHRAPAKAN